MVKGGHQFDTICPECSQRARFIEVEVSESYGAFLLDLLSDTERKFRCSACGSVFDLRDEPEPPAKLLPEPPPDPLPEKNRRRKAAAARADRIEEELAELKKRLGC